MGEKAKMKAGIDLICRKLASSKYSHTCSWAQLRANQLKHVGIDVTVLWTPDCGLHKDWSEFDTIYIYHSVDFDAYHPYNLNVFDGPQEHSAKYFERLIWPQHDHIKFISLDHPMPDYGARCKRKRDRAAPGNASMSDYWRNVEWDKHQAKCESITEWVLDPGVEFLNGYPTLKQFQAHAGFGPVKHTHRRLSIGDSHAHSIYIPGSHVLRKDKRTLRGVLKKGIAKEVSDFGYDFNQFDYLSCYWGNIDIRHHLVREPDPRVATIELCRSYADALHNTQKQIEVCLPLPIEDESRKIPSTGFYEGTPFYGTRAQRQEVLNIFMSEMQDHAAKRGWDVFKWPDAWYEMDGIEFIELLEKPRSVHLGWCNYRWDFINDKLNHQQTLLTF